MCMYLQVTFLQLTSLLKQADSGRRKLNISVSKGSETPGGESNFNTGGLAYFIVFICDFFLIAYLQCYGAFPCPVSLC